jgi:hypothetical protein
MPVVDVISACSKAAADAAVTAGERTTTSSPKTTSTTSTTSNSSRGEEEALQLLDGLREAVALLYNVTGAATCFKLEVEGPGAASVGECFPVGSGAVCSVASSCPHTPSLCNLLHLVCMSQPASMVRIV